MISASPYWKRIRREPSPSSFHRPTSRVPCILAMHSPTPFRTASFAGTECPAERHSGFPDAIMPALPLKWSSRRSWCANRSWRGTIWVGSSSWTKFGNGETKREIVFTINCERLDRRTTGRGRDSPWIHRCARPLPRRSCDSTKTDRCIGVHGWLTGRALCDRPSRTSKWIKWSWLVEHSYRFPVSLRLLMYLIV